MNKGLKSKEIIDCIQGQEYIPLFKQQGIKEFLYNYNQYKELVKEHVYWGEEVESQLYHIDPDTKLVKLQLNTDYLFQELKNRADNFELQPESGNWMIEFTPLKPYEYTYDL